jgi:hypothetical protein
MLPAPGSPLIAKGGACVDPTNGSNPLLVDERGFARPNGGPCDTGAVEIQGPRDTAAPSLAPSSVAAGQTLTCNPGGWSGDGILSFSYTWLRDGTPINGQSGPTYVTQPGDVGHKIACQVTASSAYGHIGGPATSNAVSVTTPAPTVSITRPADGASYLRGQIVDASYSCASPPGGSGIASCVGTVANGAAINTSTLGVHAFLVTATDHSGHATTKRVSYTVTSVVISGARESHRVWRERGKPGEGKPPVGTTFKFTLSATAQLTLKFTRSVAGRRVSHKCLAVTRSNGSKPSCRRLITATLKLNGNEGSNALKFVGKLPGGKRLAPGNYTLTITTPGGNTVTLRFAIVS